MTFISFNFTKISAERTNPVRGKISINRSCNPTKVEEVDLGSGQKGIRYDFEFSCEYTPDIATIALSGNLTEMLSGDAGKKVLEQWNKDKTLPSDSLERVMNAILNRCHVEALLIAKELNIPPPFNLPKVRVKDDAAAKVDAKKE